MGFEDSGHQNAAMGGVEKTYSEKIAVAGGLSKSLKISSL
jgi:hypothetical protein